MVSRCLNSQAEIEIMMCLEFKILTMEKLLKYLKIPPPFLWSVYCIRDIFINSTEARLMCVHKSKGFIIKVNTTCTCIIMCLVLKCLGTEHKFMWNIPILCSN